MTKKYLMRGFASLAICAAFASCSNEGDVFDGTKSANLGKYEASFINRFGTPAPTQDWGFNKAATRAAQEFGWELSEGYDMNFDKAYYDDVFTYLPEEKPAGNQLTNYEFLSKGEFQFSIIYAQTSAADIVGYYYYNPATQTIDDRTEVPFVENIQSLGDYVQISYDGESWEGMDMYMAEHPWKGDWGSTAVGSRAKVFTVNIPAGYRVGFYIINAGIKMYTNNVLNTDDQRPEGERYYSAVVDKENVSYLVGFEDWSFKYSANDHVADCNDVILAINQKTSTPPTIVDIDNPDEPDEVVYEDRVICEDLGTTDDFDFNDVVFDVRYENGDAYVKVLCIGGTLPLYVGGREVHELAGATIKSNGLFDILGDVDLDEFKVENVTNAKDITVRVNGTALGTQNAGTVKQENAIAEDKDMYELNAEVGQVPQKIRVDTDYVWCSERQSIDSKYGEKVKAYVAGQSQFFYK